MKPRTAAFSLALALLLVPVSSPGQQAAKVYRIGYLGAAPCGSDATPHHCPIQGNPLWQAWVEGLREHGYLPG
jgi:hypothetical protein